MATLRARPVRLNAATRVLEPVPTTVAPNDLSTWGGTNNYRIESGFAPANAIPNNTVIDTLGIYTNNSTVTLTIGSSPSDKLTIASGLLAYQPFGGHKSLTNGCLTSGTNELNILTGDSASGGDLKIYSPIVGNLSLAKAGIGDLALYASNTYAGATYVNGAYVVAQAIHAIPGDAVVGWGGILKIGVGNAIATNGNVTVREGGTIYLSDSTPQTNSAILTMTGGTINLGGGGGENFTLNGSGYGVQFNGGTITGRNGGNPCPLYLLTDVRSDASLSAPALWTTCNSGLVQCIDFTLTNSATRTFNVADSASLPATSAEMIVDMPIRETVGTTARLLKMGDGALQLQKLTPFFTGGITVTGGTLIITGPYTLPSVKIASWTNTYPATLTLDSTNGLFVGQALTGAYVQARTTITSIGPGLQIGLSTSYLTGTAPGSTSLTVRACSAAGLNSIDVGGTGILAGDSLAPSNVTVTTGGTLAPGTPTNSVTTFTVAGNLDLSGGGTLSIDLAGNTSNDAVVVLGNVILGGSLTAQPVGTYIPRNSQWTILSATGSVSGAFANKPEGYGVRTIGKSVVLVRMLVGSIITVR